LGFLQCRLFFFFFFFFFFLFDIHILFLIRTIHKMIKCLYIEQCKVENQWTAAQKGGNFPFPDLAWSKCLCSPVGGG
jgi:hypothetical protein